MHAHACTHTETPASHRGSDSTGIAHCFQIEQQNEHLSDQLASLHRMLSEERTHTVRATEALESEKAEKSAAQEAVCSCVGVSCT